MKNFVSFIVVAILVIFSSCQKDLVDNLFDGEKIKMQLLELPAPSTEVFQNFLLEGPSLKSATDEGQNLSLVQVFLLDYESLSIDGNSALRYFVYYEINANGYRQKFLTIEQKFQINDGILDEDSGELTQFYIGCPFSKTFDFSNSNYFYGINCMFHFDDGREFFYFSESNSNSVKLPPIYGGRWQLHVSCNDGDMRQEFMTNLIDYHNDDLISLKFEIKDENVVSYFVVAKEVLHSDVISIQLRGEESENSLYYKSYRISRDGNSDDLIYPAPFKIKSILLCRQDRCKQYFTEDMEVSYDDNGIIYYRL